MMAAGKQNNADVSFKANSAQDPFLHSCKYFGSIGSGKGSSKK
jgi:hypothetical protein